MLQFPRETSKLPKIWGLLINWKDTANSTTLENARWEMLNRGLQLRRSHPSWNESLSDFLLPTLWIKTERKTFILGPASRRPPSSPWASSSHWSPTATGPPRPWTNKKFFLFIFFGQWMQMRFYNWRHRCEWRREFNNDIFFSIPASPCSETGRKKFILRLSVFTLENTIPTIRLFPRYY